MNRVGKVYFKDIFAGIITETEDGFSFQYDENYSGGAISLTMPLKKNPYESKTMIPFFDGVIPEGWLLDIAEKNWKVDQRDRMGLLLLFCKDCIGAVSVIQDETSSSNED